jgi:dihydroorotate dehydrogenase electron transfer subunit
MAEKYREKVTVLSQTQIAPGIYSMWMQTDAIAAAAVPGQFVSVYSNDSGRMLPRPISICEVNRESGALRIVYRVAGRGTDEFSRCIEGDTLDVIGPLGNGFPLERCPKGKKAFLIGGGIGVPPMVELSKQIAGEAQVVAGYRDASLFLKDELSAHAALYVATEDGSVGTRGNVLDCIREHQLQADVIFACGPTPMLRAIKAYAAEHQIECWLSLEEKMACGIGACLGCVCKSTETDEHSKVHNKRICKEGPVFAAEDIEL